MQTIDALNSTLRSYLDPEQTNHVRRAYYFAEQAHYGQLRRSGEPYVTHPLAVASILADMHMDHQSLMAAIRLWWSMCISASMPATARGWVT
jgi:guanosine-3',5'-bis(diphosphate) 3'-pyrophosphohydrolase